MSDFLTFDTYPSQAQMLEVSKLLAANGIETSTQEEFQNLDSNFTGANFSNPYILKLKGEDFAKASAVLAASIEVNLDEVEKDYLLLQFTVEELQDVVAKPDEWGFYNYNIAQKLLEQKGYGDTAQIEKIKANHIEQLSKERNADPVILLLIYVFMLLILLTPFLWHIQLIGHFGFVVLPPWVSLIAGWALAYSKKTLPNGTIRYYYNPKTRMHGKIIFYLTLVGLVILFAFFYEDFHPLLGPIRF